MTRETAPDKPLSFISEGPDPKIVLPEKGVTIVALSPKPTLIQRIKAVFGAKR